MRLRAFLWQFAIIVLNVYHKNKKDLVSILENGAVLALLILENLIWGLKITWLT